MSEAGTYMVTSGTYLKQPFFHQESYLDALQGGLLKYARKYGWQLEAWAVFPNHYHFVAHSPPDGAEGLAVFLAELHQKSAAWVNRQDGARGRKVWHNFWETRLTHQSSYWLASATFTRMPCTTGWYAWPTNTVGALLAGLRRLVQPPLYAVSTGSGPIA
ncbi:MAG: transposase [Verrucomicrobiota bacterium JB022]|nr:transposase [Verrucomicrobiota bacterium JB022]